MHGTTDWTARIEMQREICARIAAFVPTIDLLLICMNRRGDGFFRGVEIRPRRSGGNIPLAFKAFAKLCVGAADMLVERVAAAPFVASEIVAIA
jgi:hypothetical protein